ncbi:MAG: DUF3987 domain-containing protein [Hyphomonadaceae bacterium]|nr:DUF3987 domain-containing protein [Hyphomonadaceae bacterium]
MVNAVLGDAANGHATAPSEPIPLLPPKSDPLPYPMEALGAILGPAAKTIAGAVQCPPAIAAHAVLGVAALAVQGHYDAKHPITGSSPCSLALITIAESGERKSTADRMALRCVEAYQAELQEEYTAACGKWRAACEAKAEARKAIKKAGKSKNFSQVQDELFALGADPTPPIRPQHIVGDPNIEGLIKFCHDAPGSIYWSNNDAGQSIGGTALSDDNRLKFTSTLSKFWDGDPIDRVRGGDGYLRLTGRRLSTHLMMQAAVSDLLLGDAILQSQGYLARVLVSKPATLAGKRLYRPPPSDLQERLAPYETRVRELLQRKPKCTDKPNELVPTPLPWAPTAEAAWREIHDKVEKDLADGHRLAEHRAFGAKIAENIFRLATVLQAFNNETAGEITEATMLHAIQLGEFYLEEACRMSGDAAVSGEIRLAEHVRRQIVDPQVWPDEHVSARAIQQYGPTEARQKGMPKAIIETLVAHGWLEPTPTQATVRGHNSKDAYRIRGRTSSKVAE